jgi:hypothetical protein
MVCRQFYINSQQMAPLPADRIIHAPSFTNVGLDFAEPLYLKNRGEKAYICLFTCTVTRAVHFGKQHDNQTVFAGVTTYSC